jgi:membrane-bound lytic murein transglycosylase D
MRRFIAIVLSLLAVAPLFAQQNSPKSSSQSSAVSTSLLEDWVNNNIDPDVLRALNDLDDDKVQKLLSEMQQAMDGTNIHQLTTLRQTATQVIPILEKYDETAPFADWLQTRLDYLETAQELEREVKAVNRKTPGLAPLSAPTLSMERQAWRRVLEKRPWPAEAKNYVPQLKAVFAAQRAPPELVWIAEVESSFHARARSPAGAAGMFQLMPQTAKDEQLSLWPWDERLQPEKSAAAAARYLRALHDRYGDWQLALAAYNVGPGRIDKLLKHENARTFEAIARRLPIETQMYVPKVEATIRQREGVELQDLKMPG